MSGNLSDTDTIVANPVAKSGIGTVGDVIPHPFYEFNLIEWNDQKADDLNSVMNRTNMVVEHVINLLGNYQLAVMDDTSESEIEDKRVVPLAREIVKVFKKLNLHLADEDDYVQVAVDSFVKKPLKGIDGKWYDTLGDKAKALHGSCMELQKITASIINSTNEYSGLEQLTSFFMGDEDLGSVSFVSNSKFPIAIVMKKMIDVAQISYPDDESGTLDIKETKRNLMKLKYLSTMFAKTKHMNDDDKSQICDMIDGLFVGGRCSYPKKSKDDTISRFVSRKLARTVIKSVREFFIAYVKGLKITGKDAEGVNFDVHAVRKLSNVLDSYFESVGFNYLNENDIKDALLKKDFKVKIERINPTAFQGGIFRGPKKAQRKLIGAVKAKSRKKKADIPYSDIQKGWVSKKHEVGKVVQQLSEIQKKLKKDLVYDQIANKLFGDGKRNTYQVKNLFKYLGNTRYSFNQLVSGNRASPSKIADHINKMFSDDARQRQSSAFLSDSMFSYNHTNESNTEDDEHLSIDRSRSKLSKMYGSKLGNMMKQRTNEERKEERR